MADQPDETAAEVYKATESVDYCGMIIGEFELQRKLGAGGMGEVYLAHQKSLKRSVAVKLLRPELAANTSALLRFRAEAEAVAKINHANIVQVHAIGEQEGLHYMVLEYVEGKNLREYLSKKGTPDLPIALNIMRQIAAALVRASELGIVHRDIKPENILLTRKGEVKVADFGLSRCFGNEQPTNITRSGVTMGTPLYMSPEQVQGKVVDPRSDIYSFGVTCYHMLKGEPPFRGATAFEVALQHVQNAPPSLAEARPDLPADLSALVHKMMAKKPDDRYQNAREILRELSRIREGLPLANPPQVGTTTGLPPFLMESNQAISGQQASALMPVSRGMPRWMMPIGVFAASTVLGAGMNYTFGSNPVEEKPVLATKSEGQRPTPNRKRIQELQKTIDEGKNKIEVSLDDLLELAFCLTREKQFEEAARQFEESSLKFRGSFRLDTSKPNSPPLFTIPKGLALKLVSHLGKGIVLAQQDQPNASNAEFKLALEEKRLAPKGKELPPAVAPPVEIFLKNLPNWKKAVSDAVERNAVNLPAGAAVDPLVDPLRSYLPRMSGSQPRK